MLNELTLGEITKQYPHHVRTYTGKMVDLLAPKPEQIDIHDIAYALSRICRFTGHTHTYLSVAEHSINVVKYVMKYHCLRQSLRQMVTTTNYDTNKLFRTALLHDATEAYLGDVSSPLKQLLPTYKSIEETFATVIAQKYNLYYPFPDIIKDADTCMLSEEWHTKFTDKSKTSKDEPYIFEENQQLFLHIFSIIS